MKLTTKPTCITITFCPEEYCLVKTINQSLENEWTLNYLIDRSAKGKSCDLGGVVLHLHNENEVEQFKKAGFEVYDNI